MLADDVRKLPKPRSKMTGSGYTHLLDTVTTRRTKGEIEVGWGKYYGPMVENGTVRADAVPHVMPTFQKNKQKYYQAIDKELYGSKGEKKNGNYDKKPPIKDPVGRSISALISRKTENIQGI